MLKTIIIYLNSSSRRRWRSVRTRTNCFSYSTYPARALNCSPDHVQHCLIHMYPLHHFYLCLCSSIKKLYSHHTLIHYMAFYLDFYPIIYESISDFLCVGVDVAWTWDICFVFANVVFLLLSCTALQSTVIEIAIKPVAFFYFHQI